MRLFAGLPFSAKMWWGPIAMVACIHICSIQSTENNELYIYGAIVDGKMHILPHSSHTFICTAYFLTDEGFMTILLLLCTLLSCMRAALPRMARWGV